MTNCLPLMPNHAKPPWTRRRDTRCVKSARDRCWRSSAGNWKRPAGRHCRRARLETVDYTLPLRQKLTRFLDPPSATSSVSGTLMRAANLLVTESVPDVPGEVPAFRFSRQESFVHLNRTVEVPVDVAVAESEIELLFVGPIRRRGEDARLEKSIPPRSPRPYVASLRRNIRPFKHAFGLPLTLLRNKETRR
jgi:hypothetical protein